MRQHRGTLSRIVGVIPHLTAGLLACCLAAPPAGADDIYVNTVDDTFDEYCTTLALPPWSCSLREALTKANETPGKDTIHLQPGTYVLSRVGADDDLNITGDLDILDDVDIKGVGAGLTIIDGNQTDRAFHVHNLATPADPPILQLFDLTVQHGAGSPGGGILNFGSELYLWRCEVKSNFSEHGGLRSFGGTTLVVDSTFANNGPVVLDPNDPTPTCGGGIYLGGGTMLVIRSTLHSNRAHQGPAIRCDNAILNIVNTTFADNVGLFSGASGALHLVECDTVIDSTTFSGNERDAISGSVSSGPGLLTLRNTYIDDGCNFADINFCPTSEGANVSTGFSCCLTHPTDVEAYPPNQVGPLGDHGGHTWTMLPLTQTILVDNSDADANCQPEDQRGISRPQEGYYSLACDVGAVELRPEDLSIFTDGFETGDTTLWSETVQ